MTALSDETRAAIDKIQKLLNLAAKNPNEAEAAAATAKASELLERYNLDAATVENNSTQDGRREELKVDGGFYAFQRELWAAIAELNFCLHWIQQYRAEATRYVDERGSLSMKPGEGRVRQKVSVIKNRHRLIGRVINTRTTVIMAQYLSTAIERILEERLKGNNDETKQSNWAQSFRKGCTRRVVEKVQERRNKLLVEEHRKKQAAERAGVSTGTSLTLSTYVDQETDANNDFIHGEGWSARKAAQRAEWAAERAQEAAAYTAWAKANPEEARKKEEERQAELEKDRRRSRYRGGSSPRDNTNYSAFYSGYDAGSKISIDPQVDRGAGATRRLK